MKVIKAIVNTIACILIFGGLLVFLVTIAYNHSTLQIILADPVVQASLSILIRLFYCILAIILGFVFLLISLKIGAGIRSKERKKRKLDHERRKEEKWEEEKEELLKGYSEEDLKK